MRYFKTEEFNCPCCDDQNMNEGFLYYIDEARRIAGVPFVVTSGFRCEKYQKDLKKRGYETATGTSPHQKGVACDIAVSSDQKRWLIVKALLQCGFTRFGVGSNFVHVDSDEDRNDERIWYYKR